MWVEKRQLEQKVQQLTSATNENNAEIGQLRTEKGQLEQKIQQLTSATNENNAELGQLRAENGQLEQKVQQFASAVSVLTAAGNSSSGSSSGCSSRMAAAAVSVPSFAPSKSDQRLATERLFHPASHQNAAMMMALWEELGLDSSDVNSAEAMLKIMKISHPSYLQRLAACLKIGPQMLFKQAFLS